MSDTSICPVCGSRRSDDKSGSLTQWILSCDCENKTLNEAAQTLKSSVCSRCGKKIKGEESGSITQFIFGFAYCSCEVEERLNVSIPNMPPEDESLSVEELEAEPELQVSPLMFPLERYKPLSILWENFAGTLYLARDRMLKSLVTIRVARQLDTQQVVEFQKWSQNLSKINHDSVVRVLNFGVTESMVPYLVCAQPEGAQLSTLLEKEHHLNLNDSRAILASLCAGLRAAHQHGIYYRIITTEDIIVAFRGEEFRGILLEPSVLENPDKHHAETGGAGKWLDETGYKADSFTGSQPSEVYSMACVLFQMLSGSAPFTEKIVGLNELDIKPRLFDVPENSPLKDSPELERLRVLFKNTITGKPGDRIRSVDDFESALDAIESPSVSPQVKDQSIKQATMTTPLVMVALLVALGASLVWGVMLLTEPGVSERVAEQQHAPVKKQPVDDDSLSGAMTKFESKKWTRIATMYTGSASNTDADFAVLNGVADATDIALQSSDHVTGEGLAAIDKQQLQRINIQSAKLNDAGFKAISNFENLEWLALGVFDKVTPSGFEHLRRLKKLRFLSLTRVRLPENAFEVITKLPNLDVLEIISADKFNHADLLNRLDEFEHLEHLGLVQLGINDKDCEVISKTKLNHIRFFDFLNNEITDKGVEWLSKARIYELDLSGNKITDKSLASLATTKTLIKLTLKDNPQVSQKAREIFRARAKRCQLDDLEL